MRLIRKPSWSISENEVTSETAFLNRRALIAAMGMGAGLAAVGGLPARAATAFENAAKHPGYRDAGRAITPEAINATYNNFYEFGSHKQISGEAQRLTARPWSVKIDGMVEAEIEIDIDDLIAKMPVEERIYRHRCVEAWSMVVPWVGLSLGDLLKRFEPTSQAKYVAFETLVDPEQMPGQRRRVIDWPYREGLRLDEAMNPLAILAVGMYGRVLPNQNGAPIRLVVPWKYGFKSIKSIVKIRLTRRMPSTTWNERPARPAAS